MGRAVKDLGAVKLLNSLSPKSNSLQKGLLRLALDLGILGVIDFWKKSFFDQNLDWILMDWPSGGASPLRTTVCRLPGRGLFFPQITGPWNFRPHFGDFRIFWIQKRRGISPEAGYTNFQPVMFDMDPFGGKKVPCTKYQESGITASRFASKMDQLVILGLPSIVKKSWGF